MTVTMSGRPPFRSLFTTQKVVSGPWGEPMDIVEAKLQSRMGLDSYSQDEIIRGKIGMARESVERDAMRALLWQQRTLTLDDWPDRIDLYCCPVRSDTAVVITYLDTAGAAQTLATSVYKVRYDLEPATITLKSAQYWPALLYEAASITVTFAAGYAVPFTVNSTTDVLTFIGYVPTNGNSFVLTNSGGSLPAGLAVNTNYCVVNASGSTCKLSLTSGGAAVDITGAGVGLHFLGAVPQSAMEAMRKLVALSLIAREGDAPPACEDSYYASIRNLKYTFR